MNSARHNDQLAAGDAESAELPKLEAEDVRALADIGFIALSRGLDAHAEAIFTGLSAARPEQDVGAIGGALVLMLRGDVDAAIAALRKLGPGDTVQAFLGLALARQGHAPRSPRGPERRRASRAGHAGRSFGAGHSRCTAAGSRDLIARLRP